MVVKWNFFDANNLETYQFEVNPNEGGELALKKNIQTQNTVGPGGKTLVFEGADEPKTLSFSGTILSQAQHDAFVEWFNKRHQIQLTDDLGNVFMVYITSYAPKRGRAHQYPWKRTYTMEATVIDWVS